MGDQAAEDFRRMHPEIGDEAVEALVLVLRLGLEVSACLPIGVGHLAAHT
jgi:hypothetical protein